MTASLRIVLAIVTVLAAGPRIVNTLDGQKTLNPDQPSDPLKMLEAEAADLDSLPDYDVQIVEGAESGPAADLDAAPVIPDDLADAKSNDGMIKRDDLLAVATAEGVTLDGKETKADLLAKITQARAAKA